MQSTANPFPEADWKALRSMMSNLVERASARGVARAEKILSNRDKSAHERFLELGVLVESERVYMADMFDNIRRTTASMALAKMVHHGVVKNEDLAVFTKKTRKDLEMIMTLLGIEKS